jgi:hypothetical protein
MEVLRTREPLLDKLTELSVPDRCKGQTKVGYMTVWICAQNSTPAELCN